jgi:hypothetical protein
VKMMSKLFFISLVVTSGLFCSCSASSMEQRMDFVVRITNESNYAVKICNSKLESCQSVAAGAEFVDSQPTNGQQSKYFRTWIQDGRVTACDANFILSDVSSEPIVENGVGERKIYKLAIIKDRITKVCAGRQ